MEADTYSLPVEGRTDRTVPNPYYLHGVDPDPYNSGYVGKVLRSNGTFHPDHGDPLDTTSHDEVGQGMWVVTHANHDSTIATSTFDDPAVPDFNPSLRREPEAWDLPPIAHFRYAPLLQRKDVRPTEAMSATTGHPIDPYRDVVVVSPASRDGGVPSVRLDLSEPGGDDVPAR
jgi:hypothetical protein